MSKKTIKLNEVSITEIEMIAILEIIESKLWINPTKTIIPRTETIGEDLNKLVIKWVELFKYTEGQKVLAVGEHSGECTKFPITCVRCICEKKLAIAKKFINYIKNEEYTCY